MKAKIITVAQSVLAITGIKITGGAGFGWDSCTDDGTKPFRANVSSSFQGKPTLAESEQQVDQWIAVLRGHGWGAPQQVPNSATRYLAGPNGFSLTITPHLDPELQSGADLLIRSECIVTDDVGSEPGEDITHQLQP